MNYLALGDSISIDDYTGVPNGGAVQQFARWIGAEHLLDLTSDGQRTDEVLTHLEHVTFVPEVITLTAGGNDFLLGAFASTVSGTPYSESDWREVAQVPLDNLRVIVEQLARYRCPVILNTIYDPTDGDDRLADALGLPVSSRFAFYAINDGIRALAQVHGFLLADLAVLFHGHGMGARNTWVVQHIEPNYAGATAIARLWHQLFFGVAQ